MRRKILAGILAATIMLSVLTFFTGCPSGTTVSTPPTDTTASGKITLNTTLTMPDSLNTGVLSNTKVQRITANELATMMNNNEDFILVDTRDTSAYGLGHIPGAINMSSYPPGAPFTSQLTTLPKDKLIIFYCK
jgi:hypothetical protein